MPSGIQIKTPDAILTFEFDWSLELQDGVSVVDVVHGVPDPLQITQEEVYPQSSISKVWIGGGVHGGLYVIKAQAELSTGEHVPGQFTLRVIAPTV